VTWTPVDGVVGYTVQLAIGENLVREEPVGPQTSYQFVGLEGETTYRWRVRAETAGRGDGEWSPWWNFTTGLLEDSIFSSRFQADD
jgi:hypothetical protein